MTSIIMLIFPNRNNNGSSISPRYKTRKCNRKVFTEKTVRNAIYNSASMP